jgi:hypothetical protein
MPRPVGQKRHALAACKQQIEVLYCMEQSSARYVTSITGCDIWDGYRPVFLKLCETAAR